MGRHESEPAGRVELERSLVLLIRVADAAGERFERDLVLRDPVGERDHAHPSNWTAFSYVGASSSAS